MAQLTSAGLPALYELEELCVALCFSSVDGVNGCACAPRPLVQIGRREWDDTESLI